MPSCVMGHTPVPQAMQAFPECMVEGDTVQTHRNFLELQKGDLQHGKNVRYRMVHDPEPERYYDWMMWKLDKKGTICQMTK